ncbi:MAG: hypothetical protein IT440_05240 [Phycisphaeraceae bacterium]|nr:hypothetical protein [Phycisphaeraceae bacterium]
MVKQNLGGTHAVGTMLLALTLALAAAAGDVPATQPDGGNKASADRNLAAVVESLPHLRVDRQAGVVELDAKVIRREAEWLELLACSAGTREHESILSVAARPSHIHLALLLVGAAPGTPMQWKITGDKMTTTPARGQRVAVTLRYLKDGRNIEVPAHQWIEHRPDNATLPDNIWLFTGSAMVDWEGQRLYRADVGGTVLSLVHFGDDLLARNTDTTNQNDDAAWGARTAAIPPVGTEVTIRLKPVPESRNPPSSEP